MCRIGSLRITVVCKMSTLRIMEEWKCVDEFHVSVSSLQKPHNTWATGYILFLTWSKERTNAAHGSNT